MAENWGSRPHPKPGTDKAVRQKKAIADGYSMAASPSPVKLHQSFGTAYNCAKVPGITNGRK